MKKLAFTAALALAAAPSFAQDEAEGLPSPGEIVDAAPASDWAAIAPEDLLVMDLAPGRDGNSRRVIIQLMPPPFSQGWIDNMRLLARAHWWDGTSVYRVQDNYVVQWGDETGEKPLPEGLKEMPESEYIAANPNDGFIPGGSGAIDSILNLMSRTQREGDARPQSDAYGARTFHSVGWQLAGDNQTAWPVHCYGMVGVGRDLSPNTGNGAELYTVIGHAPRHLDRNIALVGRIVEGMEHLSSLPRGHGALGFYDDDEAEKRVPILSVRLGNELKEDPAPGFEYLSTESDSFARYAEARANRRDPFFIVPAGGADICNIPVPIRRVPGE
jgi:peptidylprolyl isomerase